jgi:hypothetical protein
MTAPNMGRDTLCREAAGGIRFWAYQIDTGDHTGATAA